MRRRHPLPAFWLMTDPRFGDGLLDAVRRLPFRSGVIFRHYDMALSERKTLFRKVAHVCRQRGHILLLAGDARLARAWRADGFHQRSAGARTQFHTAPVHNRRELAEARRTGADALLISPLFPTASHPDAPNLGLPAFDRLARQAGDRAVIALGGMNRARGRMLFPKKIDGWAAIDAFRSK